MHPNIVYVSTMIQLYFIDGTRFDGGENRAIENVLTGYILEITV